MNQNNTNSLGTLGGPRRMESRAMRTWIRSLATLGGVLVLLALAGLLFAAPAKADLPPTPCTTDGATTHCELWAVTGTLTMPDGAVVPVWGFAASAVELASVPGPLLLSTEAQTMVVTLHNQLPGETVALAFPGQVVMPDLDGVAAGGTVTYTFTLANPGTFIYEAGMTDNGVRQVAMGMYGAMVVRPAGAPGQAYDDAGTVYDEEALLVLGEIDPALNADPGAFELHTYAPRYWLINGQAYPDVPEIEAAPGQRVLLRYANAGLESHWMGLLGLRQQIIATDGQLRGSFWWAVSETVAAGQTLDTLVTIPAGAVQDTRYALYDTNLLLHNDSQRLAVDGPLAFGGMMTFLHTSTGGAAPLAGPVVSNAQVSPSPTTGASGATLSADLTSGGTVVAAEFFTNTVGAAGTGTAMTLGGAGASAAIPAGTLANWPSGFVVFYVRGQDANGWGPVGSTVLNLDKAGPETAGMGLSPEPTNGTAAVALQATGDDHSTGGNDVVAASYTIDGVDPQPMTLATVDSPIASMTATLSTAILSGLAEGLHPIAVTAQDSARQLGVPSVITLTLDLSGPVAPLASVTPNLLDLSGAPQVTSVRLRAVITDALTAGAQSPLANAEGFIDTVGADGTGFALFPSDGLFDEISEAAYFDIPVAAFLYLAQGQHVIYVHGLDAAGNWGVLGQAIITIDRGVVDLQGPAVLALNVTLIPAPGMVALEAAGIRTANSGGWAAVISAQATDPGLLSNVTGADWSVVPAGNPVSSGPLQAGDGSFDTPNEALTGTINISGWAAGVYTLTVQALDGSSQWGDPVSTTVVIRGSEAIYLPIVLNNS